MTRGWTHLVPISEKLPQKQVIEDKFQCWSFQSTKGLFNFSFLHAILCPQRCLCIIMVEGFECTNDYAGGNVYWRDSEKRVR